MNKKIMAAAKPKSPDGEYLSCKEAAELVRLSEISVRRMLTRGTLKRYKLGARTLVSRSELMSLIRVAS